MLGTNTAVRLTIVAFALLAASAAQASDPKNGAQVFGQCQTCHNNQKGGANGLGPNLFGIVGRKAGTVPGFFYSAALKSSGIVWTNDKLNVWLQGPSKMVPGTRMYFSGLNDPGKRTDLIAYLDTLK